MERVEGAHHRITWRKAPETLSAEGFSDEVIRRLIGVRESYQQGKYSEMTLESKRLDFARWLFQNGKIAH